MVSVRGLGHEFDGRPVLRDIDFEVAPGEIFAIMGGSGGGKTTLLRCVAGLVSPTRGEVLVDGVDVREAPEEARRRMGMVFQSAALFDFMSVRDNIMFGAQRRRRVTPDLVARSLETVGMGGEDADKMPAELSGGMRKRVGIARALALGPAVMLYDEPTTGLDPIATYTIDRLIASVRRELGATSLLVSHDVGSVARVADRIAFLSQGRFVFVGPPAEFLESDEPSIRELVEKSRATRLD